MKDVDGKIQYRGRAYRIAFNLNVMEAIQNEYGSVEAWGKLTDGTEYAKREYIKQTGSEDGWDDLKEKDRKKYEGEPDAKAVIFGFTEMINEGIDIDNEENGTNEKPLTLKQVGRMITEIGLGSATSVMNKTVVDSAKSEEKNA
jgi:hypothetical protein